MTIQSLQFQAAITSFDINMVYGGKTGTAETSSNAKSADDFLIRLNAFRLDIRIQTKDETLNQSAVAPQMLPLPPIVSELQYNGRPLTDLTQAEAADLVSADGHFGVAKTAQRIADFVLKGAGDNLDALRAGREGMLNGFKEAEKIWGGRLPDISYDTIKSALAAVDDKIKELDGSLIHIAV